MNDVSNEVVGPFFTDSQDRMHHAFTQGLSHFLFEYIRSPRQPFRRSEMLLNLTARFPIFAQRRIIQAYTRETEHLTKLRELCGEFSMTMEFESGTWTHEDLAKIGIEIPYAFASTPLFYSPQAHLTPLRL